MENGTLQYPTAATSIAADSRNHVCGAHLCCGAPSRSSPEPDCAPSVVEACLCQEAVMITVRLQCLVLRRYGVEDAN